MNKQKSQMIHFRKRCIQRAGTDISPSQHAEIVQKIQRGQTKVYEVQSNRVTIHIVALNDLSIRVVYDKIRKQCVTILPAESNLCLTS